MADTNELQNEINTLLGPSGAQAAPQLKPITPITVQSQTQNTTSSPAELPSTTPPKTPQPEIKPAIDTTKTSQVVPHIQRIVSQEVSNEKTKKMNLTAPVLIFILLTIAVVIIFFFQKTVVGPLTYADCLEIEGSTQVTLEPRYCVTPEGKIFFENRKLIPGGTTPLPEFNPENIPTTNLPQ